VIDDRIANRRRQVRHERRRSRLRRTLTVTTLVVLLLIAWAIERSPLVALEEVAVTGTRRLEAATVRRAADLAPGTSTLRLDLDGARRRVESLPLVASATVRRVDPLTVAVDVVEREPVATLRGRTGAVLIDADGIVVQRGSEPGLAVIDALSARLPAPGGSIETVPAAANALAALAGLPGPLRTEIDTYVAIAEDELELRLASGVRVRVGRADRLDEKARAIGGLLEERGDRDIPVIDVRTPTQPVFVP
jgi:cell division protein FtsQ